MTQDEAKALVGERAAAMVADGMRVGLGTGTTSEKFIAALGARVQAGELRVRCVASSDASAALGRSRGLEVVTLNELPELDLYIDGADQVGPQLALIKGGGGALLREKIVASAAARYVVVVDESKLRTPFGVFPLPVEVIRMALPIVLPKLAALGLAPQQRPAKAGDGPYLTDEGNFIVDCACGEIADPEELAAELRSIVGVVEHGLFLGYASEVLVAGEDGVRVVTG